MYVPAELPGFKKRPSDSRLSDAHAPSMPNWAMRSLIAQRMSSAVLCLVTSGGGTRQFISQLGQMRSEILR